MKHIINGCGVNLRTLSDGELAALVGSTQARIERANEELDSLRGEQIRRCDNVVPLFDYTPTVA